MALIPRYSWQILFPRASRLRTIYFDIGYLPARAERNAAKMAAHRLGVPIEIVEVPGIVNMVSGHVPVDELGKGELDKGQPTPYPPDKNYVVGFHVLLSMATYYALLAGIPYVATALIFEQFEANARLKEFVHEWPKAIAHLNPDRQLHLLSPFQQVPKADVIKRGAELSVDFTNTWSCHRAGPSHCGECLGCQSRRQGFVSAGIGDPTTYSNPAA